MKRKYFTVRTSTERIMENFFSFSPNNFSFPYCRVAVGLQFYVNNIKSNIVTERQKTVNRETEKEEDKTQQQQQQLT